MCSEQKLKNSKLNLSLSKKVQQELQNSELEFEFPVEIMPTKYNWPRSVGRIF